MRRATIGALVALALLAGACRSSTGNARATTTTTTFGPLRSTTSTTLGVTNDPAFHTRRAGVLTVATNHYEPPYFDIDIETGSAVGGYEFDVARALATRLGLGRVRIVRGSLDSIQRGFDCACDVFLSGVLVTDALARKVDLSVPYVEAGPAVLVRAGALPPTQLTAPSLRWALVADDDIASRVNLDMKPVTPTRIMSSSEDVARAVATGEIDAGMLPAPVALLTAKADPTLAVVARFEVDAGWAAVEPLGSANSPSLNDLMERMADDGTLAFINRLHLGVDPAALPVIALR